MGLREKARKSMDGGASADAKADEPVPLKADVEALEAEAKDREDELRRELSEAKKLSDAKGGQITRQDAKIEKLEGQVRELESASTGLERESARSLKQAKGELEAAQEELAGLRKSRAAAKETGEQAFVGAGRQWRRGHVRVDRIAAQADGQGHPRAGLLVQEKMLAAVVVWMPVHGRRIAAQKLLPIHADIAIAGLGVPGEDLSKSDKPACVLGPALDNRKLR